MFTTEMLWEILKTAGFAMTRLDSDDQFVRVVLQDNVDIGVEEDEEDPQSYLGWVMGSAMLAADGQLIIDNDVETTQISIPLSDPDCFKKMIDLFHNWQESGRWPGNDE